MKAGTARIDITPGGAVWMDGMIRSHKSEGVRNRLYVKALALSSEDGPENIYIIASADVCVIARSDYEQVCKVVAARVGIPPEHIILAATHNHSGPATIGCFNPKEELYSKELMILIAEAIGRAVADMRPALVGCGSGVESTISHYRRLLAKDGRVIMNWEPHAADQIVGPLGEIDPEIGVLKALAADAGRKPLAVLFNHAGHPNVMSGDNYLLCSEYPGLAEAMLERRFGGTAVFVNGAQGTMDIDGLKDRDWAGMERVAGALAAAVLQTLSAIDVSANVALRGAWVRYALPARRISERELAWAESVLSRTAGKVAACADGVGDDYKAVLFKQRHSVENIDHPVEQVGLLIGDTAWISFPGELFTEIGVRIKRASPFRRTYIIGLANGSVGYLPTRAAVRQGGYEAETRLLDESAEEIVFEQSLNLLQRLRTDSV